MKAPNTHLCATIPSSYLVQNDSRFFDLLERPAPTPSHASECNAEALMLFVLNMTSLKEVSGVCRFILECGNVAGHLPHALQLHPKYATNTCTQAELGAVFSWFFSHVMKTLLLMAYHHTDRTPCK